jgi:hypothetical protein
MMHNGRPGEKEHGTYFYPQGHTKNVNSLKEKSDVSGLQWYSGQWENTLRHGEGKIRLSNARTFSGQFETGRMKQGQLHELYQDDIVTISQVTYDAQSDYKNQITPSKQKPTESKLISKGN